MDRSCDILQDGQMDGFALKWDQVNRSTDRTTEQITDTDDEDVSRVQLK